MANRRLHSSGILGVAFLRTRIFEQNRCEDVEPYETLELCVGVRIFIFVMLSSNLVPETVSSDQDIDNFHCTLQSNAGIACSSWHVCSLLYHFRFSTR